MSLDKYRVQGSRKGDLGILLLTVGLALLGLLLISSASIVKSYEDFGSNNVYLLKQTTFIVVGIAALITTSLLNYRIWKKMSVFILIAAFFLMLLVHTPLGVAISGARRWLEIGPVLFQPSEFMKLAFIIYMSTWLEQKKEKITSLNDGVVPFAVIMGVVILFVISQKDLGTTLIISIIGLTLFYVSGAKIVHIFSGIVGGALLFMGFIALESYRLQRLLTFLNPKADIQGAGYQINQALIAIGSGGLWGLGFGQSRQKYLYLPQVQTDAIFAVTVEELGFIRVTLILLVILYLLLRILKIAKNSPDSFGKFFATGVTAWILSQTLINIAGIMGAIPLTGIPLPFISYGGSSLLFLLASMGIVYNISRYAQK